MQGGQKGRNASAHWGFAEGRTPCSRLDLGPSIVTEPSLLRALDQSFRLRSSRRQEQYETRRAGRPESSARCAFDKSTAPRFQCSLMASLQLAGLVHWSSFCVPRPWTPSTGAPEARVARARDGAQFTFQGRAAEGLGRRISGGNPISWPGGTPRYWEGHGRQKNSTATSVHRPYGDLYGSGWTLYKGEQGRSAGGDEARPSLGPQGLGVRAHSTPPGAQGLHRLDGDPAPPFHKESPVQLHHPHLAHLPHRAHSGSRQGGAHQGPHEHGHELSTISVHSDSPSRPEHDASHVHELAGDQHACFSRHPEQHAHSHSEGAGGSHDHAHTLQQTEEDNQRHAIGGQHHHEHHHSHHHSHEHSHHTSHSHEHTPTHTHDHSPTHDHDHTPAHHEQSSTHSHEHSPAQGVNGASPGSSGQRGRAKRQLIRIVGDWKPRNGPLPEGAALGKVLFVDAYTAGAAGDMLVAALLDLGVPLGLLEEGLLGLGLPGFSCQVHATERSAIRAPRFVVQEDSHQPYRDYAVIQTMLQGSALPAEASRIAQHAFRLLAEAEASVHGVPVDSVHFHEVGAVDSIVDIVASSLALAYLGVRVGATTPPAGPASSRGAQGLSARVEVSPLPMGRGIIGGAAHGPLPCPAPATLDILCRCRMPTYDAGCRGELVTPTGACLLGTVAAASTHWPSFAPERASYGAGTKSWRDRPNLLRIVLGSAT